MIKNIFFLCIGVRCGTLPNLSNGEISLSKTLYGEEATFTCYDGFHLIGSKSRVCMLNGTWSGLESECISMFSKFINLICKSPIF